VVVHPWGVHPRAARVAGAALLKRGDAYVTLFDVLAAGIHRGGGTKIVHIRTYRYGTQQRPLWFGFGFGCVGFVVLTQLRLGD
jgi:hypothetical protein